MKPDPHPPDTLRSDHVADLPPKRKWFGYAAVVSSMLVTYGLWLAAMGAANEWYNNRWIYPAKVGSHGTVILMCWAFILATRVRRFAPLRECHVESVEDVGDAITEIMLKPGRGFQRIELGQFVYVSFDADAVDKEPHPFSISTAPESVNLRLSIKRLGDWTSNVDQIKPGKSARVWGPYGHFTGLALDRPLVPLVMIGGGIGITPFLSLLASDAFARRRGKSILVYAIPDRSSAVYLEELRSREEALPELSLNVHYSDESGYVDRSYLEKVVEHSFRECLFMICGPSPLIASMRSLLTESGVEARQIIVEEFQIR